MEVIPALNCQAKDFDCIKAKVQTTEGFAEWVHLDVADGIFTFNKTWNDPENWQKLGTKLKLEAHLMVEDPLSHARNWLKAGAKRLIIHVETINPEVAKKILKEARAFGAEVMLSLEPETQVDRLATYAAFFSNYQVLAVHPGLPAQEFIPKVLEKIKFLKSSMPAAKIEVDGGINKETAKLAKDAGADIFVAASFIFGSSNAKTAYEALVST